MKQAAPADTVYTESTGHMTGAFFGTAQAPYYSFILKADLYSPEIVFDEMSF